MEPLCEKFLCRRLSAASFKTAAIKLPSEHEFAWRENNKKSPCFTSKSKRVKIMAKIQRSRIVLDWTLYIIRTKHPYRKEACNVSPSHWILCEKMKKKLRGRNPPIPSSFFLRWPPSNLPEQRSSHVSLWCNSLMPPWLPKNITITISCYVL